jgi:S-DNA-T family DNA segregation ATPase FtsK/SpoIIIE
MVGPLSLPVVAAGPNPSAVECLATVLTAGELPPALLRGDDSVLTIGRRFDDGRAAFLDVPDGEHVLVVGPARSGRSTALLRIVTSWRDAHPDGWWRIVSPRRSLFDGEHCSRSLEDFIADLPISGRVLIAVDDAELVDDVGGMMASLAASRRRGLLIVATGKPDSLRHTYGHWTGVVRRSRLGLVASAANDLDGDLLGAMLPRRAPITPRPGLMWLVSDGTFVLNQVAVDTPIADRPLSSTY